MQASVGIVSAETCPHCGQVNWQIVFGDAIASIVVPIWKIQAVTSPVEAQPEVDAPLARRLRCPVAETLCCLRLRATDALEGEAAAGPFLPTLPQDHRLTKRPRRKRVHRRA